MPFIRTTATTTAATTTTTATAVCAWEKPVFFMPLANSRNTNDDSDPLSL
jgi:hypothetical protein